MQWVCERGEVKRVLNCCDDALTVGGASPMSCQPVSHSTVKAISKGMLGQTLIAQMTLLSLIT